MRIQEVRCDAGFEGYPPRASGARDDVECVKGCRATTRRHRGVFDPRTRTDVTDDGGRSMFIFE